MERGEGGRERTTILVIIGDACEAYTKRPRDIVIVNMLHGTNNVGHFLVIKKYWT